MSAILLAAAPFAPVDQEYLFEARQMQALSFAVHIALACFGMAEARTPTARTIA